MKLSPAWNPNRRSVALAALFAVVLAFAVAGVWALANATLPRSVPPPSKPLHIRLMIAGNGWQTAYESNASWNNTAFSFLLEGARSLDLSVTWQNYTVPANAVFVSSVGGDVNGNGGRWWQYWIDGAYGSVGADHAALNDGDVLEWRFAPYPP